VPPDIQHVHVVMWEPSRHMSPTPFEFMWSRDLREASNWRAEMLNDQSAALTVYSATLPLPTDGDFVSDEGLERSLRHILTDWPRDQAPPSNQALNGRVEHVSAA
jgi:hypothetical protein